MDPDSVDEAEGVMDSDSELELSPKEKPNKHTKQRN